MGSGMDVMMFNCCRFGVEVLESAFLDELQLLVALMIVRDAVAGSFLASLTADDLALVFQTFYLHSSSFPFTSTQSSTF